MSAMDDIESLRAEILQLTEIIRDDQAALRSLKLSDEEKELLRLAIDRRTRQLTTLKERLASQTERPQ
jgi:hypothetical protein